jgi:hypothetical protein
MTVALIVLLLVVFVAAPRSPGGLTGETGEEF